MSFDSDDSDINFIPEVEIEHALQRLLSVSLVTTQKQISLQMADVGTMTPNKLLR